MRTAVILIRHVPPQAIPKWSALVTILLPQNHTLFTFDEGGSIAEHVIECCSSPVICLAEGFLVESVNTAFTKSFGIDRELIIAHPFEEFVPRIAPIGFRTWGQTDLYAGLESLITKDSGELSAPGKIVFRENRTSVQLHAFAVPKRPVVVILAENRARTEMTEAKCESLQRRLRLLSTQQLPDEFAHHPFGLSHEVSLPSAVMIAVHLTSCFELVRDTFDGMGTYLSLIDRVVRRNSSFRLWTAVFDTTYIVAGFFGNEPDLTEPALTIALDIIDELTIRLSSELRGKVRIALASGGPMLRVITAEPSLQICTDMIGLLTEMINALSSDSIIASEEYGPALKTKRELYVNAGPQVMEHVTVVISRRSPRLK
jgi:hypothetical protein